MKNEVVGKLWNNGDIEIVKIVNDYNGSIRLFALNEWNGEAWCGCWEVADADGKTVIGNEEYCVRPVSAGVGEPDADGDYSEYEIVDYKLEH